MHYQRFLRYGDPTVPPKVLQHATLADYLAFNSDRSGGPDACWPWTRTIEKDGYGQTKHGGKYGLAHRLVYELMVGPIPGGLVTNHLCHDPETCKLANECPHRRCTNPAHIELTTSEENVSKGRHYEAEQTHCLNGHSLGPDGDVRLVPKRNRRICLVCDRARKRRYYHRKVAA